MKWLSVKFQDGSTNPYYIKSDCGRYTISRSVTKSSPEIFTAWRGATALKYSKNADDCRNACQKDSESQPVTSRDVALKAISNIRETIDNRSSD